jgi:hypothetical protein
MRDAIGWLGRTLPLWGTIVCVRIPTRSNRQPAATLLFSCNLSLLLVPLSGCPVVGGLVFLSFRRPIVPLPSCPIVGSSILVVRLSYFVQ